MLDTQARRYTRRTGMSYGPRSCSSSVTDMIKAVIRSQSGQVTAHENG
jgi:hypothetical protein